MCSQSSESFPESVLVTGGAGFVGSNLAIRVREFFPSSRVVVMDNLYRQGSELNVERLCGAGCEFVKGDIRERGDFPEGPFEVVLECSAEPSVLAGYGESPDYLMQTNFNGTYECLEKCRQWNAKIIFFSTSRVYPIAAMEMHPWREESSRFVWEDELGRELEGKAEVLSGVWNPSISSRGVKECLLRTGGARSLYGFTKYASEMLIEEYREGFGLEAVVNRCSVIAGPWQMGKVDQGVVALWVLRHYFKQPLSYIGYGGTGKQVRDVLHIDDLGDLVVRQLSEFSLWEGWCGNVGGGLEVSASLCELSEICREVTGNRIEIGSVLEGRQADLRLFLADTSLIYSRYDWAPQRSVRQIVEDVHQWVKDHEDLIRNAGVG